MNLHTAHRVFDQHDTESPLEPIENRSLDAIVRSQTAHKDPRHALLTQRIGQAHSPRVPAFKTRVTLFVGKCAARYNHRVIPQLEIVMEFGSGRLLNAVRRPLTAVFTKMYRLRRMPIAGYENRTTLATKRLDATIQRFDDLIAFWNRQSTPWTEVLLWVNNKQCVVFHPLMIIRNRSPLQ